jgi:hypothetical protein
MIIGSVNVLKTLWIPVDVSSGVGQLVNAVVV